MQVTVSAHDWGHSRHVFEVLINCHLRLVRVLESSGWETGLDNGSGSVSALMARVDLIRVFRMTLSGKR